MIWQRPDKHTLFIFFFVASVLLANAGMAVLNYGDANDNYTTCIEPKHHIEQASGPSFPNFINQFVELCESKEEIGEKNFKRDKETPQRGIAFNFSKTLLHEIHFGNVEEHGACNQTKPFYILFHCLRIFC